MHSGCESESDGGNLQSSFELLQLLLRVLLGEVALPLRLLHACLQGVVIVPVGQGQLDEGILWSSRGVFIALTTQWMIPCIDR